MKKLRQIRITALGVDFPYHGDCVIWLWPWKRGGLPKYISTSFSGTGEWGDARFPTLRAIAEAWDDYFKSCQS